MKRQCCLCRVWCAVDDCSERVQTSNFLSATVLSCRESNSHRRNGRDADQTVFVVSGVAVWIKPNNLSGPSRCCLSCKRCQIVVTDISPGSCQIPWASGHRALKLLVGRQEEHPACKNWAMRCWFGYLSIYLSGARCRLFAYGPGDATAFQKTMPHLNQDWFHLSWTSLPRLSWKEGR